MFEQIVFAIDPSQETGRAVALLVDLAQRYQSAVTLLSVAGDESVLSACQVLLDEVTALFQEQSITVQPLVRAGNIPFVICDVADEVSANLIVMGCRGLTEEHDTDSVSRRVIALAPCPVLVVP